MDQHEQHRQQISLTLEIELADETLTGRARNGTGPARSFAGWLGLLGAIDALIGEKTDPGRLTERAQAAEASGPFHPTHSEEYR